MHGREAAEQAANTAQLTFEQGALADDLPSIEVEKARLQEGLGVLAAYVEAGLAASNGEVRRHIKGGSVRINDQQSTDERRALTMDDVANDVIKLSLGKKKHVLIRPI
jgi:tyrosyl-tRNA synthetase